MRIVALIAAVLLSACAAASAPGALATHEPSVSAMIAPSTAVVANAACGSQNTSTLSSASGPIAKISTTSCYDVVGSSTGEIRASINASPARPNDQNSGAAVDAKSVYTFNFHWTTAAAAGRCRATTVSAAFNVEFTYPRWIAPSSPPELIVLQWNAYVAALQAHESGHELNGIDATNDGYAAIKALSVARCADFNAAAQAAIDAVTARAKQADVSYDATTNHGATQGARFP